MAITYNHVTSSITNPGTNFIPVRFVNTFLDSNLVWDSIELYFQNFAHDVVFSFTPSTDTLYLGLPTPAQSYIYINTGGLILLSAPGIFQINATTNTTPPTLPPVYLPVNVNGSNYKIKLQPA